MVMTVLGAGVPLGRELKVWMTGSEMLVAAGHVMLLTGGEWQAVSCMSGAEARPGRMVRMSVLGPISLGLIQ